MRRAPHLLLTTTAVTLALAAAPAAHAEGKPGDVHDPTLGQVAPADAAERLLRASHVRPCRARAARSTHRRYRASAARFSGHEQ